MMTNPQAPLDHADLDIWWEAMVTLHLEEAQHAEDPLTEREHLFEAARICLDELGRPERGYSVIADTPVSELGVDALILLIQLAEKTGDLESAASALRILGQQQEGVEGRATLLRAAQLYGRRLGDAQTALTMLMSLLDETPGDKALLAELAFQTDLDDLEQRADLLHRQLAADLEPPIERALWMKLGQLYENRLARPDLAYHAYSEAQQISDDGLDAIFGMYRVLLHRGDPEAQAEHLNRCRALVAELPEASQSRFEAHFAELAHRSIGEVERGDPATDPVQAIHLYRAGIQAERVGHYADALDDYTASGLGYSPLWGALRSSLRLGDAEKYAEIGDSLARICSAPLERAMLFTELGRALEFELNAPNVAAEMYARSAQLHTGPLGGNAPGGDFAIADHLRSVETHLGTDAMDSVLSELMGSAKSSQLKARLIDRRAELALVDEQNTDRAARLYENSIRLLSENALGHRTSQLNCRRKRNWGQLLIALQLEADTATGPRRLELLGEIAETQLRLGAPKGAEDAWRACIDLDPRYYPALVGLGQLLDTQGRWRELTELISAEIAHAPEDPVVRTALLGRLAEVYEFNLDEFGRAAAAYEAVLQEKPGAPDALAGLERTHRQLGNGRALIGLLREQADVLEDPRALGELHLQLGDLCREYLSDSEAARRHYEMARQQLPEWGRPIWALEWLLGDTGHFGALSDLYEDTSTLPSMSSAVNRHKRALCAPENVALPLWAALASADEGHLFAAWSEMRLRAELGDERGVCASLTGLANALDGHPDALALIREAAERGETELGPDRADALWARVSDSHADPRRPWQALQRLRRIWGSTKERIAYLESIAEVAADVSSRSAAHWVRGLLLESSGSDSAGWDALRRAHQVCPEDVIPIWLLLDRKAYRDDVEHATLLRRLAQGTADMAAAARWLTAAGRIHLERLGDMDTALRDGRKAVHLNPGDASAAEQLERVLVSLGRTPEVIELHENRLALVEKPEERAQCLYRLAMVRDRLTKDLNGAIEALEQFLALQPDHEPAKLRYAELLRATGRSAEALPILGQLVDMSDSDGVLARSYLHQGHIRLKQGESGAAVVEDFQRAAALDPTPEVLLGLGDAHLLNEEWQLALMAYKRLERLSDKGTDGLLASIAQAEALIGAGRVAEAQRRLGRHVQTAPPDGRCLERAARILTSGRSLTDGLRGYLSSIVAQESADVSVPTERDWVPYQSGQMNLSDEKSQAENVPARSSDASTEIAHDDRDDARADVSADGGAEVAPPLFGETSADRTTDGDVDPILAGPTDKSLRMPTMTWAPENTYSGLVENPTGLEDVSSRIGELPEDGHSQNERMSDPNIWSDKAADLGVDTPAGRWLMDVACWLRGDDDAQRKGVVIRPLTAIEREWVLPDGISGDSVRIFGEIVHAIGGPLADEAGRAEIAAEGWAIEPDTQLAVRARAIANGLGVENLVLVQSDARPYTVDLYRREPPTITLGSYLLGSIGLRRASFLLTSVIVAVSEGLPTLSFTPAAQAFDQNEMDMFFTQLKSAFSGGGVDEPSWVSTLRSSATPAQWAEWQAYLPNHRDFAEHRLSDTMEGLRQYVARVTLLYADSFGAAVDMVRQLDFDDRPRGALTTADTALLVRDNRMIRHLLAFATSENCLKVRSNLADD